MLAHFNFRGWTTTGTPGGYLLYVPYYKLPVEVPHPYQTH